MINKKINTPLYHLLLLLFLSSTLSACTINIKDEYSKELKLLHEKTFPISPGKKFVVDCPAADIMLKTWDKSEVYVKIFGNEKAEDKIKFEFRSDNEMVEVSGKKEGSIFNFWGSGIQIKIEVIVPSNFHNKLSTSGGDIRIKDVSGSQLLNTSGGDIWIMNTSGKIKAITSGGDINIDTHKGESDVSTSGGDIKAINFEGQFKAETSGGDINLKGENSKIMAETSGGNIFLDYEGENQGISLSTSGGDIQVLIPADFNAAARLYTSGGDIDCNLTANNIKKISSTKFEADLNKGGNLLEAETSGGDVVVKKK
ncbi:MAG: DUF4097 family beta strand repeat protein [Ignavibacteriaceae bacterium]|nr:DUF4097 family beta strand repeat protein [Ignavibacteriaceae bacterium]